MKMYTKLSNFTEKAKKLIMSKFLALVPRGHDLSLRIIQATRVELVFFFVRV